MVSVVQLCYTVLGPLSFLSELILIYSFWKLNQFKHHPEILVFWQCFSQMIVDLHWLTGITWVHHSLEGSGCLILGGVFLYFYYLGWDYTLWLSVEILLKLLNPQNTGYDKRRIFYHLLSHGSSLAVFITIAVSGTNGESVMKTCCVENGSAYEFFMAFPVVFHFPICAWIVGYSIFISSNTFYANHLKYHMIVVATFSLTWFNMGLIHGLNYKGFHIKKSTWFLDVIFNQISAILGASSGFCVFLARLMQKGLFKRVLLVLFSPSSVKVKVNRKKF
jgi:hypothetical protein